MSTASGVITPMAGGGAASVALRGPDGPIVGIYRVVSSATGEVWVGGESTENPHLAITTHLESNGMGGHRLTGEWTVTHVPTGKRIGPIASTDVRALRDFVRLIAFNDWSHTDLEWWAEHGPTRAHALREAWDRVSAS